MTQLLKNQNFSIGNTVDGVLARTPFKYFTVLYSALKLEI